MPAQRPPSPSPPRFRRTRAADCGARAPRAVERRAPRAAIAAAGCALALAIAPPTAGIAPGQATARAADAPTPRLLIGAGIHRTAPGFDARRTAGALRQFGFDGVRDELGNAAFDAGPHNPGYPTPTLATLAALHGGSAGDVLAFTGGGSRRYAGGLPITAADRAAYVSFVGQATALFAGASPTVELFNEWNLPTSLRPGGLASDYATIVRQAAPRVRLHTPGALLLVGAIGNDFRRADGGVVYGDWTRQFIATGAWSLGDALSVHLYANCMTGADRRPARLADRLRSIEAELLAHHGGHPFPIAVTEVGWPAANGACGFSPEERLAFPAQFLLMAAAMPFVRGVWFYELTDRHSGAPDIEDNFGLLDDQYRLKPAACGLATAMRLIRPAGVAAIATAAGVTTAQLPGGARVVWAADGDVTVPIPAGLIARPLCAPALAAGQALRLSQRPVVIAPAGDRAVATALDRPFGG